MKKIILSEIVLICALMILVFFSGVTFGLIFIAILSQVGMMIMVLHTAYKNTGNKRYKMASRTIYTVFLLFILSFSIIEAILLKTAFQSHHIKEDAPDAVIILGAGLKGRELSNTLRERLDKGADLLEIHENVPVVVSGGQGPGESIPEAEAMGSYLIARGIKEDRILYDKTSTTTYENLRNAKLILKQEGLHNKKLVIVTSDYHIFRAQKIGDELSMNCTGLGSQSPLYITTNYMIREYFAVVNMMLD
ncbi:MULTISPECIES: YdcF family protein [Bacillaceae]|uniref:YdcF family protein n=1 Tax=Bacillaceae TaxID=186817 RepID=UPI001C55D938|nr:YdcF family protein [Rossellomorea sp. YZS02]MBW3114586.1 YdcF family protein [Bacillus sp. MCCB 382]MDX8345626.1 YdcF family protein [Rossellomorea sp. YZS02]